MNSCQHPRLRIDGIYEAFAHLPRQVAWTCLDCETSGGTVFPEATEYQRREALRIDKETMLERLRASGL